eukprot:m.444662 g.444662  ORF g.444662 m.444662 type:complete len:390 (-) comp19127_c0_seq1:29-1198(-)
MAAAGAVASVVFDYAAQNENELSIRTGTLVTVISAEAGKRWWKVQDANQNSGFVPANYLEVTATPPPPDDPSPFDLPPPPTATFEDDSAPPPPSLSPLSREPSHYRSNKPKARAKRGTVIYPYAAARDDELSVEPGMVVDVLESSDDGWVLCTLGAGSPEGWLPESYVDIGAAGPAEQSAVPAPAPRPGLTHTTAVDAEVVVALYAFDSGRPNELSIVAGQKFTVLDRPDAEWAHVQRCSDKAIGYVPSNYIESEGANEEEGYTDVGNYPESPPYASHQMSPLPGDFASGRADYFHGMIARSSAEALLAREAVGTFLIRESETVPGSYSVTVNSGHNVKHFKILASGTQYTIGERSFPTMDDLVLFYRDYPIFTSNDTKICLRYPAARH